MRVTLRRTLAAATALAAVAAVPALPGTDRADDLAPVQFVGRVVPCRVGSRDDQHVVLSRAARW